MSNKEGIFTKHLREYDEGYFEHFLFSLTISIWLLLAAATLFLHAIFPFLFVEKTTRHIKKINQVMQIRLNKAAKRQNKIKREKSELKE